jgi:hypothetical protein
LVGQHFGLGQDVSQLVISAHYRGDALFPIAAWPISVYVYRIVHESLLETRVIARSSVEQIAWALLFPTLAEAVSHAGEMDRLPFDKPAL